MAVDWRSAIRNTFLLLATAALLAASPAAVAQTTSVCAACADKAREADAKQSALKALEDELEKLASQARAITTAILDSKSQKPTAQQSDQLSKLGQEAKALEPRIKAARDAADGAKSALDVCVRERCGPKSSGLDAYPFDAHPVEAACPACRDSARAANSALSAWVNAAADLAHAKSGLSDHNEWLAAHASEAGSDEYEFHSTLAQRYEQDIARASAQIPGFEQSYRNALAALADCERTRCEAGTALQPTPPIETGPIPAAKCPECEGAALKLRADLAWLHRSEIALRWVQAEVQGLSDALVKGYPRMTDGDLARLNSLRETAESLGKMVAEYRDKVDRDRQQLDACNQRCGTPGTTTGGGSGPAIAGIPVERWLQTPFDFRVPAAACPACQDLAKAASAALGIVLSEEASVARLHERAFWLRTWFAANGNAVGRAEYRLNEAELKFVQDDLAKDELELAKQRAEYDRLMAELDSCNTRSCKQLVGGTVVPFGTGSEAKANCPECRDAALKVIRDLKTMRSLLFARDRTRLELDAGKDLPLARQFYLADLIGRQNDEIAKYERWLVADREALDACNAKCGGRGALIGGAQPSGSTKVEPPTLPPYEVLTPGASGKTTTPPGTDKKPVESPKAEGSGMLPSGPSLDDLRRAEQLFADQPGQSNVYVPLPQPQMPAANAVIPVRPQQQVQPTTSVPGGGRAPTPTSPTPTPGASAAVPAPTGPKPPGGTPSVPGNTPAVPVTPKPPNFSGTWSGNGGCGFSSFSIVDQVKTLLLQGLPGNGTVVATSDGTRAQAQGVVMYGKPNHLVILILLGDQLSFQASSDSGSCADSLRRQ